MNEFAEILNLFIANVIAYTFFVAVYGFIIYNVGPTKASVMPLSEHGIVSKIPFPASVKES